MRTGLNAWKASDTPEGQIMSRSLTHEQEKELSGHLEWLASNVDANQIPKLLEYADKHYPIARYLGNVRGRISDLFDEMQFGVFHHYPPEGKNGNEKIEQMEKFMRASTLWRDSKFYDKGLATTPRVKDGEIFPPEELQRIGA